MPYKVLQENRYDSDDNDLISVYESIVNEELKKKGGGYTVFIFTKSRCS